MNWSESQTNNQRSHQQPHGTRLRHARQAAAAEIDGSTKVVPPNGIVGGVDRPVAIAVCIGEVGAEV